MLSLLSRNRTHDRLQFSGLKDASKRVPYISNFNTPLMRYSSFRADSTNLDRFTRGVSFFGNSGSGKTTAAANLALTLCRMGAGGIVMVAKPGHYDEWAAYAEMTGRSNQLIRFSPDSGLRFNFLDYAVASSMARGQGMITSDIVTLLMKVCEAAQRGNELRGQAPEQPFWRLAPRQLLDHTIDALWAAYGTLRLTDIVNFILTVPCDEIELNDQTFRDRSFHLQTMQKAAISPTHRMSDHDFDVVMNYFRFDFGRLDARTRTNITATMTSQMAPLMKSMMHRVFSTDTTIVPDLTFTAGSIIVLDFPIKYGEANLIAQSIFRFLFQQCVEARNTRLYDRPVFLWSDENHYFSTPYDMLFQTTARSAKCVTVTLSQSYTNYYATMGGSNPRDATAAYLNNFNTRFFLGNLCEATNQAAATMAGKSIHMRKSFSQTFNSSNSHTTGQNTGLSFQTGGNWSVSDSGKSSGGSSGRGYSEGDSISDSLSESWGRSFSAQETMDFDIQPSEFSALRSGPDNGWRADALLIEGGRRFKASGKHYLTTSLPMVLV